MSGIAHAPWIHILGAGAWQVPTIERAKRAGFRVVCTDMYEERPGYALADAHEAVDLRDWRATLAIAQRYAVSGIVCDTTDVGVMTMARVAETMGLPGIGVEVARAFTNKLRMRERAAAAGILQPQFAGAGSVAEAHDAVHDIGLPVVTKPTDGQSSRGVSIVREPDELPDAYDRAVQASANGQVIVERWIDGTEVTAEGYCTNGIPTVVGVSDKDHFAAVPTVATRLTYPADLSPSVTEQVVRTHQRVTTAMGMVNGITHGEYLVTPSGVYLVEVAARGAGSHVYTSIVPHLAGDDIPTRYLRYIMGDSFAGPASGPPRAANLAFLDLPSGTVQAIHGVDEARALPGVHEVLLEFQPGDVVGTPHDDRSRVGQVIVLNDTRSAVLDTTKQVFALLDVVVA